MLLLLQVVQSVNQDLKKIQLYYLGLCFKEEKKENTEIMKYHPHNIAEAGFVALAEEYEVGKVK